MTSAIKLKQYFFQNAFLYLENEESVLQNGVQHPGSLQVRSFKCFGATMRTNRVYDNVIFQPTVLIICEH